MAIFGWRIMNYYIISRQDGVWKAGIVGSLESLPIVGGDIYWDDENQVWNVLYGGSDGRMFAGTMTENGINPISWQYGEGTWLDGWTVDFINMEGDKIDHFRLPEGKHFTADVARNWQQAYGVTGWSAGGMGGGAPATGSVASPLWYPSIGAYPLSEQPPDLVRYARMGVKITNPFPNLNYPTGVHFLKPGVANFPAIATITDVYGNNLNVMYITPEATIHKGFQGSHWENILRFETAEYPPEYGLAISSDEDKYLWATDGNQVWRGYLPTLLEIPATATVGAGSVSIELPRSLKISMSLNEHKPSSLEFILDNHDGAFNTLGAGTYASMVKGSRVGVFMGYTIGATNYSQEIARYFIDGYDYYRKPNLSLISIRCIDAWGLMEKCTITSETHYNLLSDEYDIYDIIELMVKLAGGTLTYVTRSTEITTIYPQLEISPPDTAASIAQRMLRLVPDCLYFFGLEGYIVYPQSTDGASYSYNFPRM